MMPTPSSNDFDTVQDVKLYTHSHTLTAEGYAHRGDDALKYAREHALRDLGFKLAEEGGRIFRETIIDRGGRSIDLGRGLSGPEEIKKAIQRFEGPNPDLLRIETEAYVIAPDLLPVKNDPRTMARNLLEEVGIESLQRFLPYDLYSKLETKLTELLAKFTNHRVHVKHDPSYGDE